MSEKWELEELLLRQAEEWRVKKEKEEMARLAESWLTAHDRQMQELLDRFPAAAQGRSLVAVRCQCPRCQGERDSPLPRRIGITIPFPTRGLRVFCLRCQTVFAHDALAKESWAQCPECGEVTMIVVDRWSVPVARPELMPRPQPTQVQVEAPSEPPVRLRPERQFE